MPNLITGASGSQLNIDHDVSKDFYKDKYEGRDLHPTSEYHREIISKITHRATESYNEISRKYHLWREIDESLNVYIRIDEDEQDTKTMDDRRPVSMVIPLEYGVLETYLTFMGSIFFDDPMFRYKQQEPQDVKKAALLEHLVQFQSHRAKMLLNLHTIFRDSFAYGFGIGAPAWMRTWGYKTRREPIKELSNLDGEEKIVGYDESRERVVKYEGNVLNNIDPYLCLPDPNVGIHEIQKGSYFSWVEKTDYETLLEEERDDDQMFNVRYMSKVMDGRTSIVKEQTGRDAKFGKFGDERKTSTNRPFDVIHMIVKLIPKEWNLGTEDYPEKWYFKVAADSYVLKAAPLGLNHDMFPVASCAPKYDGYKITPLSDAELLYPMQEAVNWFINSHIANVRKTINDIIIVDPSMVNLPDLQTSEPGKIVRLKQSAWGRSVKDAVMQLQMTDVTRGHVNDAMMLLGLANSLLGVDTTSTVRRNTSERVSSAEARNDILSSNNKLTKTAKIVGMQLMYDLSYMIGSHTIQLMEQTQYVDIVGRYQDVLEAEYPGENSIPVTREDIDINYDIEIQDGISAGSEDIQAMTGFLQTAMSSPELAQDIDINRLFKAVARATGFKNVHEFVKKANIQSQVTDRETIDNQVQQGNIVRLQDAGGGF